MFQNLANIKNFNIDNVLDQHHSYVLAEICASSNFNIIFIAENNIRAQVLANELEYLAQRKVLLFPEKDVVQGSKLSVSQYILNQRAHCLEELSANPEGRHIVIATIKSFNDEIITKEAFKSKVLSLKRGKNTKVDNIASILSNAGYMKASTVTSHPEFAVRGSIVDISSQEDDVGYRLDFFGDNIEFIKKFHLSTQSTFEVVDNVSIAPAADITGDSSIVSYINSPTVVLPYSLQEPLQKSLNVCKVITLSFQKSGGESSQSVNFGPVNSFYTQAKNLKVSKYEILKSFLTAQERAKRSVVFSCISIGSRDRIQHILAEHGIHTVVSDVWPIKDYSLAAVHMIVSPLKHGVIAEGYAIITEEELFGDKIKNVGAKSKGSVEFIMNELTNFSSGDLVVHKDYGIGRFEYLETLSVSNQLHDCLKIIYEGDDKLYIPVENIALISKYGANNADVKLDKLGSTAWQVRKSQAKGKMLEIAQYLLDTAAKRDSEELAVLEPISGMYDEFCESFPYAETEDQEKAIEDIRGDFASGRPMDRLICGDVGFGKTEVALRAAFMAIMNSSHEKSQVALLCPTTLLCRQHYAVFKERLQNFGINVVQMSRLVSRKDMIENIEQINNGRANMIVGTHALLSDKIKFPNLSMLIIDEEQHFGVAHKEKLKQLKAGVHVLTLSATPIPRTLQMSLANIKQLSIIATPPTNRIVTKTFVLEYDALTIKDALLYEYNRGGQSFYVCPRIADLDEIKRLLDAIAPHLKVAIAHGRMTPNALDDIMNKFYERKFDVLLSTSIIESGLDIPSVNTIIIHKADKFGLGQLYQLKGRVGRSNINSFAYFTVPAGKNLSGMAQKRLQVLSSLDELGAGFTLASHDMDMRGFGNLVGEEQSGHIKEIGVELYQEMLAEAIAEMGGGAQKQSVQKTLNTQINIDLSVLIPESYITDFDLKLNLYRQASNLKNKDEINAFAAEMIDRFGPLPEEFNNLLLVIQLKQICASKSIIKVDAGDKGILLQFSDDAQVDADKMINFVIKQAGQAQIRPDGKLLIKRSISPAKERLLFIEKFLEQMNVVG